MSRDLNPELELLVDDGLQTSDAAEWHALRTAPVITGDAFTALGPDLVPQRAVYGQVLSQHAAGFPIRPDASQLYINTNAPFSGMLCGVQGSGKSHSASVLLESCLIRDQRIGTLPAPLSALVFHFDTAAGGGLVQPCEAAHLAALHSSRGRDAQAPPVKVLVMPNSLPTMQRVYAGLSGVSVEPLRFGPRDINGPRLLSMMKLEDGAQMPLYMEALMDLLRSMESNFDYAQFRRKLETQDFSPGQRSMLNLRLALLDSCLAGGTAANSVSNQFIEGQLTIIDLSSPFMDPVSACGFFDIILGLYIESNRASGKLILLDEAHKYLSDASSRLTESLLTVIRQQRHLATRVIISTQEPTVVPEKFLDLCSFIIAHRFSSPIWLKALTQHVAADQEDAKELASQIVALRTGQAIMFTASGLGRRNDKGVSPFGSGYLIVRSRLRVTRDGGHSLLAVSENQTTTNASTVGASSSALTPDMPDISTIHLDNPPCTPSPPPQDARVSNPTGLQTPSSASGSTDATFAPSTPHTFQPLDPKDKDSALIKTLVGHLKKESAAGRTEITFKKGKQFLMSAHPTQTTSKAKLFLKAESLGWLKVRHQGPTRFLSLP